MEIVGAKRVETHTEMLSLDMSQGQQAILNLSVKQVLNLLIQMQTTEL